MAEVGVRGFQMIYSNKPKEKRRTSEVVTDIVSGMLAALNSENGLRKRLSTQAGAPFKGSGDARLIEYKELYEEFGKLKKILNIVQGAYDP